MTPGDGAPSTAISSAVVSCSLAGAIISLRSQLEPDRLSESDSPDLAPPDGGGETLRFLGWVEGKAMGEGSGLKPLRRCN